VQQYSTLGYLVSIMALLSGCILPRAKFVQSMLISIFFTCLGAAVALLQIRCAVSARQHTTPTPAPTSVGESGSAQAAEYNSSASAVAAVFMFMTIYIANVVRAKRPLLTLPTIQYIIFTLIASLYAPTFPTMEAGMSFVNRILKVFLTGFGIATGVSLFIIPVSSRTIAKKQISTILELLKAALGSHSAYMHGMSVSYHGPVDGPPVREGGQPAASSPRWMSEDAPARAEADAKALKQTLAQVARLYGTVRLEIGFAKKEMAIGKLRPEDFSQIFRHLQQIIQPTIGFSTFIDIMQSVKRHKEEGEGFLSSEEAVQTIRNLEAEEWDEVIAMSHEPFLKLKEALMAGLTHISYVLELSPKPKGPSQGEDVERTAAEPVVPAAGEATFGDYLQAEIDTFHKYRDSAIRRWTESKGIDVPAHFWDDPSAQYAWKDDNVVAESVRHRQNQQQLYLILYLEYLTYSVGKNILSMVRFADSKVEDGTMKRKRFIFPGWRRLRKLARSAFDPTDSEQVMADGDAPNQFIWIGDALKHKKDPEHLPPSNLYEQITNRLRTIPQFFASPESAFACRAAVATLSLGITAYIHQTSHFFLAQRGVWALIMIAISMGAHAGQGIFSFLARILGTTVAMVASITLWYMGDQKPGAILPLFYLYLVIGTWFLLKKPKQVVTIMISMVTVVLIIGYELQDLKIGTRLLSTNGQEYYKIYVLAPYRLASVVAGLGVAFIWTYFPYPVTTHSTLRKDLGSTLYLMANFYSCMHTIVETKLRLGVPSPPVEKVSGQKNSPASRLDKAWRKVFAKLIVMLNRLREHSEFVKWEPRFGGKFPKPTYDAVIQDMQSMFNYISLIAYSANAFATEPDAEESGWLRDFRQFTVDLQLTSHEMTSMLCLVSASMSNAQPLPPYLQVPRPYSIADRLELIDPHILSIQHVAEPCYAAFAVLEVASTLVAEEMAQILKKVQDLVGEVDFSFHVVSTASSTSSSVQSSIWTGPDPSSKGKEE